MSLYGSSQNARGKEAVGIGTLYNRIMEEKKKNIPQAPVGPVVAAGGAEMLVTATKGNERLVAENGMTANV